MRVLHIISSLDARSGGPAVALAGFARAQRAAGLDVDVLTTFTAAEDATAAESLAKDGVNVRRIGPTRGPLRSHPELKDALAQAVADVQVVHVHSLWEDVQYRAARAAQRRAVPYVMRPCGMLDPWSLSQGRLKKRLYMALRLRGVLDRAAALHFTSDAERDLTAPLRLKAPPVVEPNGVRLDEFERLPPPGEFRRRHPQLVGRRVLLFLSRVHAKKGLDLLVPAVAAMQQRENAALVIAGPDDEGYGDVVRQMIATAGLQDRVIFTGMLRGADRVAALADADLFVLPSYQENFGIAVVEALAAGTPVVISDQVNIHQQITAAGVGGVVPTRVEALAAELDRWLSDEPLRRAAADRARPFVWQHYDWDEIARRWAERYGALARRT